MIKVHSLFKVDSSNKFGFVVENNNLSFHIPEILKNQVDSLKTEHDKITLLKKYLKILKLYVRSKKDNEAVNKEKDKNKESHNLHCIEGMINLMDDYFNNGEYTHFMVNNELTSSKIDWNKTIKDNKIIIKPVHVRNEPNHAKKQDIDVIYGTFISKKNKISENDLFYQLYIKTLNNSLNIFYGVRLKNDYNINERMYFHIINNFLSTHYKDREIYIAKQLKAIYNNSSFNKKLESKFEIEYHERFEHIFQFMIEETIKEYSIKDKIKKSRQGIYTLYKDEGTDDILSGLNLKMDHVIKKKNQYKILDSKFYNVDSYIDSDDPDRKSPMPKTDDIIKQVGYKLILAKFLAQDIEAKNIEEENKILNKIENMFIFPTIYETKCFGEHEIETGYDKDSLFFIKCIKINLNDLMDFYIKGIHYKKFTELL